MNSYEFENRLALDAGCGQGRHALFLKRLGFDVYACEVSAEHVAKLGKTFPDISFSVAINSRFPYNQNTFDYIVAANSMYYMNDGDNFSSILSEYSRILKPGGCLVGTMVNEDHSIILNADRLVDDSVYITNDPLLFRNNTRIRPLWDDNDLGNMLVDAGLKLNRLSVITDTCENFKRSLTYFTAYKA